MSMKRYNMIYLYLDGYYSMKLIISLKHLFLLTDKKKKGSWGDSNVEVKTTNIILGQMNLRFVFSYSSPETSCLVRLTISHKLV